MDPSLEALLTVAGNAPVVIVLVEAVKLALGLSPASVERFGPLLAIVVGIVVAEFAALALGQSGRDLSRAVLTGLVSGATAMGIYNIGAPVASRILGGK